MEAPPRGGFGSPAASPTSSLREAGFAARTPRRTPLPVPARFYLEPSPEPRGFWDS